MLMVPDNDARLGTEAGIPITRHASAATRIELLQLRSSG